MSEPKPARGSLLVVFLTVLIDLIGFGIFIPLLPFYAETYGYGSVVSGVLVATFSVVQLVFLPILGRLSDRYGRRPILLLGLMGSCVSYLLFALADTLWLLFLSRALAGMFGATIATAQAYVADVTTPATRARGMGLIGAAFGIGFTFGPPLGGWLSEAVSMSAPGYFASGLSFCAFVLGFFRLSESRPKGVRTPEGSRAFSFMAATEALKDERRAFLLILFLFQTWCFANLEAMFPLLGSDLQGFGKQSMGLVFMFVGLSIAIVQGTLIQRLVRTVGERTLFPLSVSLLAASLMAVGHAKEPFIFFLSCAGIGLGYGVASPTLNALISKNTPVEKQGSTLGLSQSLAGLGRATGHLLAGVLFAISPWVPFTVSGAVLFAVAVAFLVYRKRFPTDLTEMEPEVRHE